MALLDMIDKNNVAYYEQDFRQVLEDHLAYIKAKNNKTLAVDPLTALRYKGDFFGLLNTFGVQPFMQWITMRVNGFVSPTDVTEEIRTVVVIEPAVIRTIFNTHKTQSKRKVKTKI